MQHMEECPAVLSCDLVLFHLVNLVVPFYLRNFDKGCYWQAASMPDPAEHIAHSTCSPMQVLLQDQQFLVQPAQTLDFQDQSREPAFDDFFSARKSLMHLTIKLLCLTWRMNQATNIVSCCRSATAGKHLQYVRENLSLDDLHYCSRYSALMQLLIPGRGIAGYQSSAKKHVAKSSSPKKTNTAAATKKKITTTRGRRFSYCKWAKTWSSNWVEVVLHAAGRSACRQRC